MTGKDVVGPENGAGQSHDFGGVDGIAADSIT